MQRYSAEKDSTENALLSARRFIPCIVLLLCACSSLPTNVDRAPSWALADSSGTELDAMFKAEVDAHPGKSGFIPVVAGANAFLVRSAFTGLVERTLDLQYYIWEDDLTGRMLLRDVMRAAENGVRVRLLLDDIHTEGDTVTFNIVAAHPRIEVRLFNPFARRDLRIAGWLLEGARLNHRMHNKVMIADNAIAITGGRNIGDNYFAVDEASNFRDLDLLAVGPVVDDLSTMFDAYWNSGWAYPVETLEGDHHSAKDARGLLEFLDAWLAESAHPPFREDVGKAAKRERLASQRDAFVWGQSYVVYDSPHKVTGEGQPRLAEFLFDTTNGVREELLIETAYFVPGESGVELLGSLVERGVDVKVLTNSLATNDVVAAHAGYMGFRAPLVKAGVDLYELRPDALAEQRHMTVLASESEAALHSKALVYDRRAVFVGSFNLDPRSLLINTEMGVIVESTKLAAQVADMIEQGMLPVNSYRIVLDDGEVRWRTQTENGVVFLDTEPETSWWDRVLAQFMSLLPIKGQL